MPPLSTVEPAPARSRPIRCALLSCDQPTREHKPYCPDHLTESSYVCEVLEGVARREREVTRAERSGTAGVDLEGIVAGEILSFLLHEGEATEARLARDLMLPRRAVSAYVCALSQAGRVERVLLKHSSLGVRVPA